MIFSARTECCFNVEITRVNHHHSVRSQVRSPLRRLLPLYAQGLWFFFIPPVLITREMISSTNITGLAKWPQNYIKRVKILTVSKIAFSASKTTIVQSFKILLLRIKKTRTKYNTVVLAPSQRDAQGLTDSFLERKLPARQSQAHILSP
jgi:hypothetical protein